MSCNFLDIIVLEIAVQNSLIESYNTSSTCCKVASRTYKVIEAHGSMCSFT